MVGKRNVLEQPGVAAKTFQRLDRVDLGEAAGRRLAVEPGEKARHRRAVAQLRRARAGDLGRVLHRLHRRDRIAAAQNRAAALGEEARDRLRGGGRIEPHLAPLAAERGEVAFELRARAHVGKLFEAMTDVVAELAAVDIESRPALARHEGEGEHHRRVRNIAAADVEQPGDRMRIADHERVGGSLLDRAAHAREFLLARSRRRSADRAARRRRRAAAAGRSRSRRSDCRRRERGSRRPPRRLSPAARRRRWCAATANSRAWRRRADWLRSIRAADARRDARPRKSRRRLPRAPAPDSGRRRRGRRGRQARWRARRSR